ncbi:Predicted transcriptional regulator, containsd two HTH domains [Halovenus aranensis]|jgi:predicted transcriptional regulator|uniref:Predicted transcriptional regulator, containsd two HTH domains n=1 Tax=Halovenus aranensis TaxID=890420 RepID=A0A1G8WGR1_9EURY|nr:winged helix-turn-helix transcriptional regulator [Halovenus aranensis]SDJ77333.1 Predicted transcriptional regulator, containsd two HTH domains [Halovenus aranensis]
MARDRSVDQSKRATLRRFAALGAASPLVGFASADESDSDAPEALTGYLSTTPGAHFSKIRDDLQLGTGETQHHLRQLEDDGVVESRKDGDYRRYFPADEFSEFEQVVLGHLRRETQRGILVALLEDPGASAGDIAARLDVSRPTVSKHAARLEENGLLSRADGYSVTEPEQVMVLLVRYADSFGEDAAALASIAPALLDYAPDATS